MRGFPNKGNAARLLLASFLMGLILLAEGTIFAQTELPICRVCSIPVERLFFAPVSLASVDFCLFFGASIACRRSPYC